MAELGFRNFDEMIGRVDLLETQEVIDQVENFTSI